MAVESNAHMRSENKVELKFRQGNEELLGNKETSKAISFHLSVP